MNRRVPILVKLLVSTLAPTVLTFGAFGVLAHESARRALEEELSRRLQSIAGAAAIAVRAEPVAGFQDGDEATRSFRNVRRKLIELRDATLVRRIYLLDRQRTSRGDTDEGVPIGTRYYALDADRAELDRVFTSGQPASSLLFTGTDGAHYKRGFAPLPAAPDEAAAARQIVVGIDGAASLYEQLASFRRALFAIGAAGVLLVATLSVLVAGFITRPLRRLEQAARRIGGGDLTAPIAATSHDEIGFLAATLDRMREQLRARDERLQMMLAGIAHEVRNPLGGMALFAGILRDELAGDAEKLGHLEKIERELGHLKTVVADFLDYARRPRPDFQPTDGAAILREVREVLAADAARAGVELEIAAATAAPLAGDPSQLRRALLNLGRNALQACPPGGRVGFACTVAGGRVRLAVSDSGCGIPAEKLGAIFAPFYTTREKGTGLGLAFAAEIARDHGGEVRVSSTVGEGSTFTMDLPRRLADPGRAPT